MQTKRNALREEGVSFLKDTEERWEVDYCLEDSPCLMTSAAASRAA